MNGFRRFLAGASLVLCAALLCRAEVKITVDRNNNEDAAAEFKFKHVPAPSKDDAAAKAKFTIVEGERDENGGGVEKLNDGKLPDEADQPGENFFFNAGTEGGRIAVDLGSAIEIKQVNTYSWHPGTRGAQVYKLYASDGTADGFDATPKKGADLEKSGWKLIASVDTRPKEGEAGGQYGVSIADPDGSLGKYRYLLFDISRTEDDDQFGNTFYSEIDVIDKNAGPSAPQPAAAPTVLHTPDGKYEITIDTSRAPELKEWADNKLAPVLIEWYPKIVQMLPSDRFTAPEKFSVTFRPGLRFPAATGGTRITCSTSWFKRNLDGEARGAVVHEMVHVVQQYWRRGRDNPNAARPPGWLVEGIPDYIRWFKYEPQTHGAEISRASLSRARYDGSYRVSANFLNWVTETYDKDIVRKLNAALREGKYDEDLWKTYTGKTVQELGDEWKSGLAKKLGVAVAADDSTTNVLTAEEKKAGWKLLFDGKTLDGWHTFKRKDVLPGWQIENGVLACVDPHNAGDLCTNDKYDWFELQLDYNISVGGNSGIMYHVTNDGAHVWETGPEFQLLDNKEGGDPQKSGWLYDLYSAQADATKPAGQWNHIRLLVTPEKCEHDMNGVKYFDYVLGSDDFKQRVAKSKFGSMPNFAKSDTGYIALQGDHGRVSFRNIKIRPMTAPSVGGQPLGSGIDRSNFDNSVRPQDDFYDYVNGNWIKNNPIPPEYSRWGAFPKLRDDNLAALRQVVEELTTQKQALDEDQRKLRDLYLTAMDESKLQQQGTTPLTQELAKISRLNSTDELIALLGQFHSTGLSGVFSFGVAQDEKQSDRYAVHLRQGGLGLPERGYYLSNTPDSKRIREQYREHVARMLSLLGDTPDAASAGADTVVSIETQLAEASRTPVQLRDREAQYNKKTVAELQDLHWDRYFAAIDTPAPSDVIVGQPEFFQHVSQMLTSVPIDQWRTYLRWHLIHSTAPFLSDTFERENFHFYSEQMRGVKEMQPRWKRAISMIDRVMGEALGRLYVQKHFPPESKRRMDELVKNVLAVYRQRIQTRDWMGPETKEQALAKLATVMPKIGYPDKWRDYSALEVGTDSYVRNVLRAEAFEFRYRLSKLGQPVDRTEWHMTPPTVNAYYNSTLNEIVFPAGILQPPFFNPDADDAVNYGAIGCVIGHEITHGFDDQGSRSDAQGNLKNWWTPEDRARFTAKTDALVKQFDACVAVDDLHVNGRLTLGENIADLGGVNISYAAYQKSLNGKPAPVIDGFTGPQRFFIGFAQVWRGSTRDADQRVLLRTDPHSPPRFRTLVPLSNIQAFYDAFEVKPGDAMYRAPQDRVEVW